MPFLKGQFHIPTNQSSRDLLVFREGITALDRPYHPICMNISLHLPKKLLANVARYLHEWYGFYFPRFCVECVQDLFIFRSFPHALVNKHSDRTFITCRCRMSYWTVSFFSCYVTLLEKCVSAVFPVFSRNFDAAFKFMYGISAHICHKNQPFMISLV